MMKLNKKKLKHASISTLFIIFFVIVMLLVNVLVNFLTTRYSLKLDMTTNNEFQLDDQTKDLLHELDQDVTIYMLRSEADMQRNESYVRIMETVYRFGSESGGKIKYEFINPNANPEFFNQYSKAKGSENAIMVVESPLRYGVVTTDEMFSTDESGQNTYINIESQICSSLLYVTSEKVPKAGIVAGHNEVPMEGFNGILDANNFERVDVNLVTEEIPEEVDNLIIAGPQLDFSAEEIEKIDAFLQVPGHNLFVFWNYQAPKLTVLERYLTEWGIEIGEEIILDDQMAIQGMGNILAMVQDTDVTQSLTGTQSMLVAPNCKPVEMLWTEKSYTRVVPLAKSSTASFGRVLDINKPLDQGRQEGDTDGPFNVCIMSEKNVPNQDEIESNRVFVTGTYRIGDEDTMNVGISLNSSFLTTILSYSNDDTKTMQVMPKVMQSYDLNIYDSDVRNYMIILLIVMPLVILGIGIFVFIRRRHK